MQELVEFIASRLVDHPEGIVVSRVEEEDQVVIELRVAPGDLGKVIGKQGRTARAMRMVIAAAETTAAKRTRLEIVE